MLNFTSSNKKSNFKTLKDMIYFTEPISATDVCTATFNADAFAAEDYIDTVQDVLDCENVVSAYTKDDEEFNDFVAMIDFNEETASWIPVCMMTTRNAESERMIFVLYKDLVSVDDWKVIKEFSETYSKDDVLRRAENDDENLFGVIICWLRDYFNIPKPKGAQLADYIIKYLDIEDIK